jgi:hypothetical protein
MGMLNFLQATDILFRFCKTTKICLIEFFLSHRRIELLRSGLSNHVVGNIPKEDIAVITACYEAILSMVKVLLYFFLSR